LRRNKGEEPREEPVEVLVEPVQPGFKVHDEYFVNQPHSWVKIVSSPQLGEGLHYYVEETPLTPAQRDTYTKIVKILSKEFTPPTDDQVDPTEYVYEQAEMIAERYHRSLGKFTQEQWDTIFYYLLRDLTGYGPLHTVMEDPWIEDISCNGVDTPLYVWHRKYESIPTNISFKTHQALNDFLVKMAHKSGKHISSAHPILDAEKHRLAATFMKEVSLKGSTFCIRKYRPQPLSIIDLVKLGTLDARIAAYFWLILENKKSFMIIGPWRTGPSSTAGSPSASEREPPGGTSAYSTW